MEHERTAEQRAALAKWKSESEMTVAQLIETLSAFDQDALVLVDGYEGGFEMPEIRRETVRFDGGSSHCGPWSLGRFGTSAIVVGRLEHFQSDI